MGFLLDYRNTEAPLHFFANSCIYVHNDIYIFFSLALRLVAYFDCRSQPAQPLVY